MTDVNGDDLTTRLIDEGARMLTAEGPGGLSLRKLAAAVGTSTMAVYTRFGDKPRLLAAMHREGFRRLGERLRVTADDPLTTLAELGRAYRRAALESPHLYNLMFGPPPAELQTNAEDGAAADQTYAALVAGVHSAVSDDVLVGDPERIALHLWSVAHGMVSLELSGQLPVSPEGAAQAYDEALLLAAAPFVADAGEQ